MARSGAHSTGGRHGGRDSSDTPSGSRGGRGWGRGDSPPDTPPAPEIPPSAENLGEFAPSTSPEEQEVRPRSATRLPDGRIWITVADYRYIMNCILQFIIKNLCVKFNFFYCYSICRLNPPEKCAQKMNRIFEQRLDVQGWNWKNVSASTKEFYWNEFQVLSSKFLINYTYIGLS